MMDDNEKIPGTGSYWDDEYAKSILTPEEIVESNIRVEILCALIDARNEKKMSQREMERLAGIRQPVISRFERGVTDPRLSTIVKVLRVCGRKLAVVPL